TVWRAPGGECYRVWTGSADSLVVTLQPVRQDPDTREWCTGEGNQVDVDGDLFRASPAFRTWVIVGGFRRGGLVVRVADGSVPGCERVVRSELI
ncbi:hypothetical protein, partial [Micromonospora sp. ALFpr18c]|uniref:hypothetical protein n=1 Tax=Micromonospora sp. ALFpr18c TaxID=1458665 RepID=UPI001CECD9C6